jgi:predicted aspartyl protease
VNYRFGPTSGLIIVRARLWGPKADRRVRLALDTGATTTVVNAALLLAVGCDPAAARDRVRMTTGSGLEYVPRIALDRLEALGQARSGFFG